MTEDLADSERGGEGGLGLWDEWGNDDTDGFGSFLPRRGENERPLECLDPWPFERDGFSGGSMTNVEHTPK